MGIRVALKAVRAQDGQLPPAVANELAVLKHVPGHDGIVDIRALHEAGGWLWLEMPLCPCTLAQWLARPKAGPAADDLDQVLRWAAQVAAALGYVHAHGLVHRDVKPGNVMIDVRGNARLGDFGVACLDSDPGASGASHVGSPMYRAPETAQHPATAASDVYSLGVTLRELREALVTEQSSGAGGEESTITSLGTSRDALLVVEALVRRMMSSEPRQRPRADEVAAELDQLRLGLQGVRLTANRSPRWLGGRARGALSVTLALAVVAASVALLARRPSDTTTGELVDRVLQAESPSTEYAGLKDRERRRFDDQLMPSRYEIGALTVSRGIPKRALDSTTKPRRERCWDRTATVTAYSRVEVRLYAFTAVGYWCLKDGKVFTQAARSPTGATYAPGWTYGGGTFGSGVIKSGQAVYVNGNHTMNLRDIRSQPECVRIVGGPDGAVEATVRVGCD